MSGRVVPGALALPALALAAALVALAGCAQKAKTVQAGAAAFSSESLLAIDRIDRLRLREVQPPELSPQEASDIFVGSILESEGSLGNSDLNLLLDPFRQSTGTSEAAWQTFLARLRSRYTEFSATFASLGRGSLLGASAVKDAVPVLDRLTAQMAALAKSLRDHPVEFVRERAAIAEELESVRDDASLREAEKKLRLGAIERQLRALVENERNMGREAMAQALKAASLGRDLRALLLAYDQLSVDDIAEGLTAAFRLAGSIPGLDLRSLQKETDAIVAQVKSDQGLSTLFGEALEQINAIRPAAGHGG